MGLFSSTTGMDRNMHQLASDDINRLVNHYKIKSLSQSEELIVEDSLIARRVDGKISLWMIKDELTKLVGSKKISKYDREDIMHVFQDYFTKHFNKG